jgi:hypothetical protein
MIGEEKVCSCPAAEVKGCFEDVPKRYWPTAVIFPSCPNRVAGTTAAILDLQLAKGPEELAKHKRINAHSITLITS